MKIIRNKWWYAIAIILTILVGLGSRRYLQLGKYPGDALWTIMVFLLLGIAQPRRRSVEIGLMALFISYVVEFGQLYRAPWIVAIRDTAIGWCSDRCCYRTSVL
jgi:Protein of unknown function (DUF2809)